MTKKNAAFKYAYDHSLYSSVNYAYDRPSDAKISAEKWCREKMHKMMGFGFRIMSFNTFNFTCGWLVENPETGVLELCVETSRNSYRFEY